jgi:hypothetical protein
MPERQLAAQVSWSSNLSQTSESNEARNELTQPDQFSLSSMSAIWRWSPPVDATLYLEGEMECGLMGHKFHRGFTAAEKTESWDRWKRGESLKAIGRAFGKQSSSIYFFGGSAWWD